MGTPGTPPDLGTLSNAATKSGRMAEVYQAVVQRGYRDRRYLPWDKLRRRAAPPGADYREWWLFIKLGRLSLYRTLPLLDRDHRNARIAIAEIVAERLHQVDRHIGGIVPLPEQVTTREIRDRSLDRSLIEASITSSQLEGAATKRQVAQEMLRVGRPPRDPGERLILNNDLTMRDVGHHRNVPLTFDSILDSHRRITDETLDDPSATGRLRRRDEKIQFRDEEENVLHDPRTPVNFRSDLERFAILRMLGRRADSTIRLWNRSSCISGWPTITRSSMVTVASRACCFVGRCFDTAIGSANSSRFAVSPKGAGEIRSGVSRCGGQRL